MLKRALAHAVDQVRHQTLGAIALFVALGGTGVAAVGLPSHQASTRQSALTPHGQVVAWAIVNSKGHVVAGGPGPQVRLRGPGLYTVSWRGVSTSRTRKEYCVSPVTVDEHFSLSGASSVGQPAIAGYATTDNVGHTVFVYTFNPSGQPTPLGFQVALVCPMT